MLYLILVLLYIRNNFHRDRQLITFNRKYLFDLFKTPVSPWNNFGTRSSSCFKSQQMDPYKHFLISYLWLTIDSMRNTRNRNGDLHCQSHFFVFTWSHPVAYLRGFISPLLQRKTEHMHQLWAAVVLFQEHKITSTALLHLSSNK